MTHDTQDDTAFAAAVAVLARLTAEQLGRVRLVVIPDLQREKRGVVIATKKEPNTGE